jgi:hypothetical protein
MRSFAVNIPVLAKDEANVNITDADAFPAN